MEVLINTHWTCKWQLVGYSVFFSSTYAGYQSAVPFSAGMCARLLVYISILCLYNIQDRNTRQSRKKKDEIEIHVIFERQHFVVLQKLIVL